MEDQYITIVIRLVLAAGAGSLVGIERTYFGRPAGFRTHALVATASSLLMLLTVYQFQAIPNIPVEAVRTDPTRMAQGIMTGIGFLGAGVIIREGLTIRGLTTSASIWITASIGIMIGSGMLFAALIALILTVGTLSVLRLVENKAPTYSFARLRVRFNEDNSTPENEFQSMVKTHEFTCTTTSYRVDTHMMQYEMTIRTKNTDNFRKLAETLNNMESVHDFAIAPTQT
ncbi:MAG: magnesium transporter MgtC [SAR202 cluster bacterium Casp-Chloro-G4]|nr:MgtC/SapB family protein [Chloroflexota bacterium]MDA1226662.1 MgtC/SapB family protein [Chloroflexota bacterium]PKB61037.1 MAG: magnesium transporter MgtC [SAR202 cluster bacterium Casp-Chloro-G4]